MISAYGEILNNSYYPLSYYQDYCCALSFDNYLLKTFSFHNVPSYTRFLGKSSIVIHISSSRRLDIVRAIYFMQAVFGNKPDVTISSSMFVIRTDLALSKIFNFLLIVAVLIKQGRGKILLIQYNSANFSISIAELASVLGLVTDHFDYHVWPYLIKYASGKKFANRYFSSIYFNLLNLNLKNLSLRRG